MAKAEAGTGSEAAADKMGETALGTSPGPESSLCQAQRVTSRDEAEPAPNVAPYRGRKGARVEDKVDARAKPSARLVRGAPGPRAIFKM